MRFLFIFLIATQSIFATSEDWGKTGHRTVGEIATSVLSKKALKNIALILDGASLALVSNYGDDIKSDKKYRKYGSWHYVNLPLDGQYSLQTANSQGDIIQGIQVCVNTIRDVNASKEEKAFHLKLLVHFIGDLHQPMHIGREEDKGGNDVKLTWFGKSTNLHRVWDSNMIDDYGMSYSELAKESPRLSKRARKEIMKGTPLDWMKEGHKITATLYNDLPENGKLGYEYAYKYTGIMRSQLQKGGVRLAKMLNDIFG
jgi:hypothetical protein